METQQQQQQQQDQDLVNKNNSSSNSYLCRQSSSRWTPTSDQIRILKELYYNNGIRSPTADQIQRIASRLRHYGKIEGKNVFYWFQNHKARERQKKRFTPSQPQPQPLPPPPIHISPFSDHHHHPPHFYNQQRKLYTTSHISPPEGGSSYSSQAFIPVGSVTMEKSFMECSISSVESRVTNIPNFGSWVKIMQEDESPEEEEDQDGGKTSTQVETLPLFPIHGGATTTGNNHHGIFNMESSSSEYSNGGYYTGGNWFRSDARTSLELSLNSYGYYN